MEIERALQSRVRVPESPSLDPIFFEFHDPIRQKKKTIYDERERDISLKKIMITAVLINRFRFGSDRLHLLDLHLFNK
jgi:hypothetical protein